MPHYRLMLANPLLTTNLEMRYLLIIPVLAI
jgi:hypothetical protein